MAIINRLEQMILQRSAEWGRRLTAREVARQTGLAESTIYRMTSGEQRMITYETLDKLCVFLQCTPGDLLVYVPDEPAAVSPTDHDGQEAEPRPDDAPEFS